MLDPLTLLRLPACIAVFEEVEQKRQVLGADPLTTVSDQLCWGLLGGQWQLRRTGREVYGIRVKVVDSLPLARIDCELSRLRFVPFKDVCGSAGGKALTRLCSDRTCMLFAHWRSRHWPVLIPGLLACFGTAGVCAGAWSWSRSAADATVLDLPPARTNPSLPAHVGKSGAGLCAAPTVLGGEIGKRLV